MPDAEDARPADVGKLFPDLIMQPYLFLEILFKYFKTGFILAKSFCSSPLRIHSGILWDDDEEDKGVG